MHPGDVGPDRPRGSGVVADQGRARHQLTEVCAVVLRTDRLAAGEVDDHGLGRGGDLEGPYSQAYVVVFEDRVVVVGRVGMEDDLLTAEDPAQPVDRRASLGPVGREDPDDGERTAGLPRRRSARRPPRRSSTGCRRQGGRRAGRPREAVGVLGSRMPTRSSSTRRRHLGKRPRGGPTPGRSSRRPVASRPPPRDPDAPPHGRRG